MNAIPLAELHLHLEGTVRRSTAIELAARHGLPPPPLYEYRDLAGFLNLYAAVNRCLRDATDFERIVTEHASELAAQGVGYAEISFNPRLHEGESWLDGVVRGRIRARNESGLEIGWLVELDRSAPQSVNRRSLDIALATDGVVGLGLVGDEELGVDAVADLFAQARHRGLPAMPHAGQSGGPERVREAIRRLGARRIAHGVAAATDPVLLAELAQAGCCLCVCPSSNRRIGLDPDLRAIASAGVPIAVGSDDPPMVGTTFTRELEIAEQSFGLDRGALLASAWSHRFGNRQ